MRLLFINYETPLGTAMHATPVFARLRAARPDWEVHVAAAGMAGDVLGSNPHIDRVWHTPHILKESGAFARWALRHRREMGRYDAAIYNADNQRTRLGLLSRLFSARRRAGYAIHPFMVRDHLRYDNSLSLIQNNLRLLGLLGVPTGGPADPEIWYRQADAEAALAMRAPLGDGPVIGFFTATSGGPPNQWYDDRFIAVGKELRRRTGARLVFFGGPKDIEHAALLAKACGEGATSLAGRTSAQRLAAFCTLCDLIVTVDTGGMHVAWAVGTPSVVLGNAANPVYVWQPLANPKVRIIRKDDKVPCAICRKPTCLTRECMDEIKTDEVIATALEQFAAFPPDAAARATRLGRWVNVG